MRKKRGRKGINGGRKEGIPYYILYREGRTHPGLSARRNGVLLPSKDTKVYSILSLRDLFALGGRERGKRKTEN